MTSGGLTKEAIIVSGFGIGMYTLHLDVQLILASVGASGNIFIVICFLKSNKLRQQKCALICSLAVADLLVSLESTFYVMWDEFCEISRRLLE